MADFTDQYNTPLTPQEELRFRMWLAGEQRQRDLYDYDLRGAWKAAGEKIPAQGHLTDQFKKPNHPTFSNESQYSTPQMPGGTWQQDATTGGWRFFATPFNVQMTPPQALHEYFQRVEPDSALIFPPHIGH